jgi:hypothetical protein
VSSTHPTTPIKWSFTPPNETRKSGGGLFGSHETSNVFGSHQSRTEVPAQTVNSFQIPITPPNDGKNLPRGLFGSSYIPENTSNMFGGNTASDGLFTPSPSTTKNHPTTNKVFGNEGLRLSKPRITRSGPEEENFAIVDIPGFVRGHHS